MISKAKSRFIKSLQVKKYRLAEQSFIIQGAKVVKETLASDYEIQLLVGTSSFLKSINVSSLKKVGEVLEASEAELIGLGSIESNQSSLAVVRMKPKRDLVCPSNQLTIVLDDIRDPGNLGTMIRTVDWYGLTQIVASPETTDCFNPKVINATMGSFLRVDVHYTSLVEFLTNSPMESFGAFLDGEDVHQMNWPKAGLLIVGNESRGISPDLTSLIRHRITIPRIGQAESLNASTALAIILDNYSRGL